MTWTAELVSVEKKNGMPHVMVRFTNGAEIIMQENFGDDFDADRLKEWVYFKLESLNRADVAFATLLQEVKGAITPQAPAETKPA